MRTEKRDLIRAVRACKTAAEERAVVAKECAALRSLFNKQDVIHRHRSVAKLMYVHILGYPTHFGQMECLKLIAGTTFLEKRIGYLGLTILLDEKQEVLMLVTNSVKTDLNSNNQYVVGLALCAMGNISSAEMARDLSPEVERLIESSNTYIRKKAALCAVRVIRKLPDMCENYKEVAAKLLNDRQHGALLSGVTLMIEILKADPSLVEEYRRYIPRLSKILRSLTSGSYSTEFDVSGLSDPFLQVKILKLLQLLGHGNAQASDEMSDILAQVATNTSSSKNAGNAVLYQCVLTIMGIESVGGLRVFAVNILGRFLANKDNNIRYVALNTLSQVVNIDTQAVQRHRDTIVECVKDADISIRRRALDLVYALVNEKNIQSLMKELLEYLAVADVEFKSVFTEKLTNLVARFAPTKQWYIDTMKDILAQDTIYVKDEVCFRLVVLITNTEDLQSHATHSLYAALRDMSGEASSSLIRVAAWCVGEYGELLLEPSTSGYDAIQEEEVVALLSKLLHKASTTLVDKEFLINALMKLTSRFTDMQPLRDLLHEFTSNASLELQQRACEYEAILDRPSLWENLLERMPAIDEAEYTSRMVETGQLDNVSSAQPQSGNGTDAAPAPEPDFMADLLSLDMGMENDTSTTAGKTADALQDMLSLDGSKGLPPAQQSNPTAGPTFSLDSLYETQPVSAQPSPSFPSVVAYDDGELKVSFDFSKDPSTPEITNIVASFTNQSSAEMSNFVLQAAVPKFMQIKLLPASSNVVPKGSSACVTQKLIVSNGTHGEKSLAMRMKMSYTVNGESRTAQGQVTNFPPELSK